MRSNTSILSDSLQSESEASGRSVSDSSASRDEESEESQIQSARSSEEKKVQNPADIQIEN